MLCNIKILAQIIILIVLSTAGCDNYHIHRVYAQFPIEIKNLKIESYDPYGSLTRAIKTELNLSGITLFDNNDKNNTMPSLRIISSSEKQITTSIFKNGKTAEYQLILCVKIQIILPNKYDDFIVINVYRSFLNNPIMILAKNDEIEIIRQEMQQQAAQQIVRKIIIVFTDKNYQKNKYENYTSS